MLINTNVKKKKVDSITTLQSSTIQVDTVLKRNNILKTSYRSGAKEEGERESRGYKKNDLRHPTVNSPGPSRIKWSVRSNIL